MCTIYENTSRVSEERRGGQQEFNTDRSMDLPEEDRAALSLFECSTFHASSVCDVYFQLALKRREYDHQECISEPMDFVLGYHT